MLPINNLHKFKLKCPLCKFKISSLLQLSTKANNRSSNRLSSLLLAMKLIALNLNTSLNSRTNLLKQISNPA